MWIFLLWLLLVLISPALAEPPGAGEPVIVTGATLVTDGQPVRVIPPPER